MNEAPSSSSSSSELRRVAGFLAAFSGLDFADFRQPFAVRAVCLSGRGPG